MMPSEQQDEQQLDLLAVFHYVVAGLCGLFSLFPILHVALGLAMVSGRLEPDNQDGIPRLFGWLFVVFGTAFILGGLTFSVLLAWAGRCLARRRRYMFCMVMAALSCVAFPFGTVLGVLTLLVLSRPSVRQRFMPAS
ncbi:MAG: hypothetical protein ACREAA_08220 [Candidatus Polarisedimenticolia bacterium]